MKMQLLVLLVPVAFMSMGCDSSSKGSDGGPDGGVGGGDFICAWGFLLTTEAQAAVELAPNWLQGDLRANLVQLEGELQDELAALMTGLQDERGMDELAFCLANMSPTHLRSELFTPELLLDNLDSLFAADDELVYADIVDYMSDGDGNDFYSTVQYRILVDDVDSWVEMDREYYYWYIVFPAIEDEEPIYIDPVSGEFANPPTGRFWRDYLMWEADDTYTPLADYLAGQQYLWKGKSYDRDDNGAVGNIIQWVLDVMDFNSDSERPVQPVRIYSKHMGRCGEHSDLTSAAARSALIPSINLAAWANDHVWNEFWEQRWVQWEPVNTYVEHYYYYADENGDYHRSGLGVDNDCDGLVDEGSTVADPNTDGDSDGQTPAQGDCNDSDDTIYSGATEVADDLKDNDCDGMADDGTATDDNDADGFSIAQGDCNDTAGSVYPGAPEEIPSNNRNFSVSAWRGDGKVWTVTERYAGEFTLNMEVLDVEGTAVDGATVIIAGYSTTYPDNPAILIATWAVTDEKGQVSFQLGEANEYYYRVESVVGNFPEEDNTVSALFDDAVKGEIRSETVSIEGTVPSIQAEDLEDSSGELTLGFEWSLFGYVKGINFFTKQVFKESGNGRVNLFLVDEENLDAFENDQSFDAALAVYDADTTGEGEAMVQSDSGPWYLLVVPDSLSGVVHADVTGEMTYDGQAVVMERFVFPVVQGDFAALAFQVDQLP